MPEQLSFAGFGAALAPAHAVFFAIYPDAAAAARISQLAQHLRDAHELNGNLLAADRFHVSLCGLGEYAVLPREVVAKASEVAAGMAMTPFKIEFDRVASFRGRPDSAPLVLLGGNGVATLMALQHALGSALRKAGIGRRTRLQFTPHLTLMYADRRVNEQAIEAIGWAASEFVLVDSLQGQTQHVPLGRWPLRS
jgi:RNA 2',3'-cyclic 3'-phosphodiesterase